MQHWQVLGLEPTPERRSVKRAYARLLKDNSPEDNPDGFQTLRAAYEQVIDYLKHGVSHQHDEGHYVYFDDEEESQPVTENVVEPLVEAESNVIQLVHTPPESTPPSEPDIESDVALFDAASSDNVESQNTDIRETPGALDTHQQSLMFVQSIMSTLTNSGEEAACVIVDKIVSSPEFINIEVSEQTESLVYGELYEIAESDMPWPLDFVQHLTKTLDIEEKAKIDHRYFNLLEMFEVKQHEADKKAKKIEDARRDKIQRQHLEQIASLQKILAADGDAAAAAKLVTLFNDKSMSDPVTASIFRQEIITAIYDLDSNGTDKNRWPTKLISTISEHYDFDNQSEQLESYTQYIDYCKTRQNDHEFYEKQLAHFNQNVNESDATAAAWNLLVETRNDLTGSKSLPFSEKRALRTLIKKIDTQAPSLWDHELKRPGGIDSLYAPAGVAPPRKDVSEQLDLVLGFSVMAIMSVPVLVTVFNVFLSADTTRTLWQDILFILNKSLYLCAGVACIGSAAYLQISFISPFISKVRREINHTAANRLAAHMVFFTATLSLFLWKGEPNIVTTVMLAAAGLIIFFRYNLHYVACLAAASIAAHAVTFPLMLEYFSRLSLINMYALHLIGIQICMIALIQLTCRWAWLSNRFDSSQPKLGQWCSALAISVACSVSVMLPAIA